MHTIARPTTLLQDLRLLPAQYWILFSGTLVNRFGHFVIPFLAIYLKQRGQDPRMIGLILGAYGAGGLIAGVVGGYLADKIGRKPTMLISCVGAAGAMLLLSQAESVTSLTALTMLTGVAAAMYGPGAGALIADLIPPHLRVRAYSCQRLAINLGFALGMATAGFMAKQSFMLLFIADAGTTLILALTLLIGIKPRKIEMKSGSGWKPALAHMKANRPFKLAIVSSLLVGIVFWQMSSSYGLQVTEGAKLDERSYGLLMALNGILITFVELPLTSVTRRFDPGKVMTVGYILVGIGMGLNGLGANAFFLITSMVVFTTGEMISLPVNNSYMASLAPDEMRGRYQGVMSITWASATMLGPPLGVALYECSPGILWTVIMAMSFAAAAMMFATRHKSGT
ncbi:MAG TPA: MFS transporter [Luteolibacter sp.]|nr:MFS transporter [Luteolibacter sp.]